MAFITLLSINSPHNWAYKGPVKDDTQIYKEFTMCMAESLYLQHPEEPLHFLAINFTDDYRQQLLEAHPLIQFTNVARDFSKVSQTHYKGWLMRAKTQWILEVIKRQQSPQIFLDCDVLIRKKLGWIQKKLISDAELICLHRPKGAADKKFNVGVMGFAPTDNIFKFLTLWFTKINDTIDTLMKQKPSGRATSGGQLTFTSAFSKIKPKFLALPKIYNDGKMHRNSNIWHGHQGDKKVALKKIKTELAKLRERSKQ